jgi:GAF domain-containing protein
LVTAEQAAATARAQLRTAFNDTLAPVAQQIGKVATALTCERREALQAQTISKVLSSAVSLVDANRARACWFELELGNPRRLRPVDHVGRSTSPSTLFIEGTRSGDSVFAALDRGEGRYVRNVDAEPPAGWDTTLSRAYKTFIAVPVEVGGRLFGMLTLDSLHSDDFTGDEVPGLRLLGDLLADALAIGGNEGAQIPSQSGPHELSLDGHVPAEASAR